MEHPVTSHVHKCNPKWVHFFQEMEGRDYVLHSLANYIANTRLKTYSQWRVGMMNLMMIRTGSVATIIVYNYMILSLSLSVNLDCEDTTYQIHNCKNTAKEW